MTAALELVSLTCRYNGVTAVDGVSAELHAGQIVALLGPNGAGKSTIVRAIAGLLMERDGDILLHGRPVPGRRQAHRMLRLGLAVVLDHRALFPALTVEQHLVLVTGRRDRAQRLADAYGVFPALEPLRNRRAGLLSGGEAQMLAIARALATNPDVLIVDELSFGLAPLITDTLLQVLRGQADNGLAVLLVEQHVAKTLAIADRCLVLSGGRITGNMSALQAAASESELLSHYLGPSTSSVDNSSDVC